jgi:hypothetical protein
MPRFQVCLSGGLLAVCRPGATLGWCGHSAMFVDVSGDRNRLMRHEFKEGYDSLAFGNRTKFLAIRWTSRGKRHSLSRA